MERSLRRGWQSALVRQFGLRIWSAFVCRAHVSEGLFSSPKVPELRSGPSRPPRVLRQTPSDNDPKCIRYPRDVQSVLDLKEAHMYRQAVITFIDILGFKHLIDTGTFEDVSRKLKTIRRLSDVDDQANGECFEPKVIQFSDSIIRVRPLESKANEESRYGLMFYEMLDLVHMQQELINHGICVRGGVSIGNVHVDDQTLFGPGFVKAYELESVYANFPRIVVDPTLIQQLQRDKRLVSAHNTLKDEFAYIIKNIRRESDGIYFIDYLRAFQTEIDEPENIPVFLRNHKELIVKNAGGATQLNSVSAKYLWLASYHNSVIREFKEEFWQREELEITPKEVPLLQAVEV